MMADGYARVTGKPGVCLTSTGPGAANSMGGIGEAYFASAPVLHLTSTAEEELYERGLGTIHETKDQLGMCTAVAQQCFHISRPEETPERVREAFELFGRQRPRSIQIEIPVDVQGQAAEMEIPGSVESEAPGAEQALVERAAALLVAGIRVGILAGTGVHRSGATRALTRIAERLGAPVFTTANGKGAIAENHPLSLGIFGGEYDFPPGGREDPRLVFAHTLDTLLVVGSSLSYFRVKSQGLEQPAHLIHLDIDAASIGKWYEPEVGLVGDAKTVLTQLETALAGASVGSEAGYVAEVGKIRSAIRAYKRETMARRRRSWRPFAPP